MGRLDLHLHSHYSDGSHAPADVIRFAKKAGVTTLSLTDHDTTDGIDEAIRAADDHGIELIPGIEISSRYRGKETHVLGYFVDHHDHAFQIRLQGLRATRRTRLPQIIAKLNALDIPLTCDDVLTEAGNGSVGRPHIAAALVKRGFAATIEIAFSRYLKDGAAAYVARTLPSTQEAIQWIHEAGGISSIAHPTWISSDLDDLRTACQELQAYGLTGIEVFYSTHTARQVSDYLRLAKELHLLPTGGSDFHGTAKPGIHVGTGRGRLNVPTSLLEPLKSAARGTISRPSFPAHVE